MKKIILIAIALTGFIAAFAQGDAHINAKSLTGSWKAKTGDEVYNLNANGTSISILNGRECPGTWKVEGQKLVINPKKLMWRKADPCSKTRTFEVVSHTVNDLTLIETATKRTIQLANQE